MAGITFRGVSKSYHRMEVIPPLDLDVADGEFCVLVGPSGCGKSTLLRMLAGLVPVTDGEVLIGGEEVTDIPPGKRRLSFVFQSYALYPHMDVRRNIGFALETARMARAEAAERVRKVAAMLKIDHLLGRRPRELSGGQRQRVAIGRALVVEPEVFLFDEPLSNLDADLRMEMRFEIAKLHRELGTTMIYVTHDQTEAMTLADRIVILNHGRIEQTGAPRELYDHPANRFVAGFLGSPRMNFAPVTGGDVLSGPGGFTYRLAAGAAGQPAEIGLRPEALEVVAPGTDGIMTATFENEEDLGHEHLAYLRLDDDLLWVARADGAFGLEPGARVGLRWDPAKLHLFDDRGNSYKADIAGPA